MTSVCSENHHCYSLFTPQKLLARNSNMPVSISLDTNTNNNNSPYFIDGDIDEEIDPYATDDFRMYEFKIRRCMRSRSHDWTDCPFAHPGEKARRRDPRRFHYSGNSCADFRRGSCPRGDSCEYAHGVFECWLHPARYRTQLCKDGVQCRRKVCFFAHTTRQVRNISAASPSLGSRGGNCPCGVCRSVISSSPTSTLMEFSHGSPPLSPSDSPPISPINSYSLLSRFDEASLIKTRRSLEYLRLMELVSSLKAMDLTSTLATAKGDYSYDCFSPRTPGGDIYNIALEEPQELQFMNRDIYSKGDYSSYDCFSPRTPESDIYNIVLEEPQELQFMNHDVYSPSSSSNPSNGFVDEVDLGFVGGSDIDLDWVDQLVM